MTRRTLRSFPTSAACFAAIDALNAGFKAEFKRAPTADLVYSLRAAPTAAKVTRDTHSIALYAEPGALEADIAWFARQTDLFLSQP